MKTILSQPAAQIRHQDMIVHASELSLCGDQQTP